MQFSDLKLIEPILSALKEEGYTNPTPIQQQAIGPILGGQDLLGCAQTGTGKTAAFAIPIIQQLYLDQDKNNHIKTLILTPTRELAIQIDESFAAYGRNTKLRHTVVFGGVGQKSQTDALRRGIDILVATPGRLLDLMHQGFINLKNIKIFVLDEADRMLDMGFIHDVKKVISVIPQQRQTLFFSATMPPEIQKLANSILKNPIKVEVTPQSTTTELVTQSVYHVLKSEKKNLLNHLLKDESIESALVFTRTKHGADKVVRELLKVNIKAAAIHGNKSQNARQLALTNFKERTIRVLVATDIAARGIDVDNLTHVINYELPNVPETYVHRIGRTGRAGAFGIAISFCDAEERPYLKDIQKIINMAIPVAEAKFFGVDLVDNDSVIETRERRPMQGRNQSQSPRNNNTNARPQANMNQQTDRPKPTANTFQRPAQNSDARQNTSQRPNSVAPRPAFNAAKPVRENKFPYLDKPQNEGSPKPQNNYAGEQRAQNNVDNANKPKKKKWYKN
jgi:ATP-dependent RNA helicase RhlE